PLEHNTAASASEDGEPTTPPPGHRDSSISQQPVLDDTDGSNPGQEGSGDITRPTLDAYLDHLQKVQEEQGELEKRLERECLEEELHPSREEQPFLDLVPQGQQIPIMGASGDEPTDMAQDQAAASPPRPGDSSVRGHSPSVDNIPQVGETPPLSEYVEISFWNYEREAWRLSDHLEIDPSDPSPVERVAKKYTRKDYSLYDKNMQSLSPAQCYRAATIDGNNAVFIISAHEEEKLAADGRFVNDEKFLLLVSRCSINQSQ
ncbi:conserved hypothetical protein, partial [Aspergillus udagawae]